jgi:signal transduction histidine kinase
VLNSSGTYSWILIKGEPFYYQDQFAGYIGSWMDISPRRNMIERVTASERLYRTIAHNYPGIISLVDHDLNYVIMDGQDLERMGATPQMFKGKRVGFNGDSPMTRQILTLIDKALAGNSVSGEIEDHGHIHKALSTPISDDAGNVSSVLTHTWDVTEERKLQDERDSAFKRMQEALRVRDDFMSVAAHELKTPLTITIGYIQTAFDRLQQRKGLTVDESGYFSVALQQAGKLSMMVDTILDITRIDRGSLKIERRIVNLSEVLCDLINGASSGTNIHEFETDIPGGRKSIYVLGDELRISQVIQNILSNAIKYSPSGGRISVVLQQVGQNAIVQVTDQGIGIPREELEKIGQDRFYRAKNVGGVETGITGFGIGLFVANEIVSLHGGELRVMSDGQNKGTTVIVSLPINGTRERKK